MDKLSRILAKSINGFNMRILCPACPTFFSGRASWAEDAHVEATLMDLAKIRDFLSISCQEYLEYMVQKTSISEGV